MLAELHGKGGHVCTQAAEGTIRCPLLVRPTSEDVITGNIMQMLGMINPRWWLPDLLNRGLGTNRFHRQVFRELKIELWKNRPILPKECLPHSEGSTQVDVIMRWENPATTVYLEFKYLSRLATKTRRGANQDQILRNIRVGLHECGYYKHTGLFPQGRRRFYLLAVSPTRGQKLVQEYQQEEKLIDRLSESPQMPELPVNQFIGELDYKDLSRILATAKPYLNSTEKLISRELTNYLWFKRRQGEEIRQERQLWLKR